MKLSRTSLILLVLVLASLVTEHFLMLNHESGVLHESITETTQSGNATATRLFVNSVYPALAVHLKLENQAGGEAPKGLSGAALTETDRVIRNFMFGTDILKVKLYDRTGLTVYSTENTQISQDQSKNPSFLSALNGAMGSQITHRGKFDAIDGQVFNKDLVASYIPIRNKQDLIIGVAEIYTDRTPLIAKSAARREKTRAILILGGVVQALLVLALVWSVFASRNIPRGEIADGDA